MDTMGAIEHAAAADELTNILIVDDEPANLLVLESVLNDPGYRIVRALSADQALLALMGQEFAVMVLDIQLPDMNGIEALRRIREDPALDVVAVIAVSASVMPDDQQKIVASGFDAFVTKPINMKAFLDTVQRHLDTGRA